VNNQYIGYVGPINLIGSSSWTAFWMAKTFSALLGDDPSLALEKGFIRLSPLQLFNTIEIRLLIIKTAI
jgi:hypothetical protein